MQNPSRNHAFRRILFPYSGEEPLALRQSLRVMLAWVLLFPLSMSLCTLLFTVLLEFPWQKIALLLLVTFLSGVFIFGCLGLLVVSMNNSAARIRQAREATRVRHK